MTTVADYKVVARFIGVNSASPVIKSIMRNVLQLVACWYGGRLVQELENRSAWRQQREAREHQERLKTDLDNAWQQRHLSTFNIYAR